MGKVVHISTKTGATWIDKAVIAYAEKNNITDPMRLMMVKKTLENKLSKHGRKELAQILQLKGLPNDNIS